MSDRIIIMKIQDTMFDLAIVQINVPTSARRPTFEDLEVLNGQFIGIYTKSRHTQYIDMGGVNTNTRHEPKPCI